MKVTRTAAAILLTGLAAMPFASCIKGEHDDYEAWREQNDAYLASLNTTEYELVVPDWAPQNSVYIKWHNDRSLTADSLVAMSNSTLDIKYELFDIEGNRLGDSYMSKDSVYQSRPNQNVVGMWIAMTSMRVGDSATLIIPYPSGYGAQVRGDIKPYTNLIYNVKIKGIKALEKPLN